MNHKHSTYALSCLLSIFMMATIFYGVPTMADNFATWVNDGMPAETHPVAPVPPAPPADPSEGRTPERPAPQPGVSSAEAEWMGNRIAELASCIHAATYELLVLIRDFAAAGAWSGPLAESLGVSVPLESERGYHVELWEPSHMPRAPVMIASGKFVAAPMAGRLRRVPARRRKAWGRPAACPQR